MTVLSAHSGTNTSDLKFKEGFGNLSYFTAVGGYYILYPFSILRFPGSQAEVYFQSTALDSTIDRNDI